MFKNRSYCGELSTADIDKKVMLAGWIDRKRDLGGIIFIWIRDVSGIIQIVVDSSKSPELAGIAVNLKNEFCVLVRGIIHRRSKEAVNPEFKTGEIEVYAEEISILSSSPTPTIPIEPDATIGEDTRLRYRYLDLRREDMQEAIIKRHGAMQCIRRYLSDKRFFEIETPILNKSTPEGARDFLVPSRINKGMFYALPQSPQLFKQILMISGFDRYFQIAKCFRDEDLRNDRQPEFTQVDIEMSFITIDMIIEVIEGLIKVIVKEITGRDVQIPFKRIPYDEAMARFGKDAPDTRFGLELSDCTDILKNSGFKIFASTVSEGGIIKGIAVADGGKFSRKTLDDYAEFAKQYKAKGLPWVRYKGGSFEGGIGKFLSENEKSDLINKFDLKDGEIIIFACDRKEIVNASLGNLRTKIANDLNIIDKNVMNFIWVTDFPLLEYNQEEGRFYSVHHPFTSPLAEHIKLLDNLTPDSADLIKSQAYDIVLNGVEIGGGSIRINRSEVQNKIFSILGISPEEAAVKFSFLLEALQYGAPPHGGIALGLDRVMMLFLNRNSIRDVIAFPKTTRGQCLMSGAPSPVSAGQLDELCLKTANDKNK